MIVPLEHVLLFAAALFFIGLVTVVSRRNLIMILLGVEVMLNAAGLVFIAGGARWGQADGQVMFLLILALAAAEVAVGLALILQVFHRFDGIDADRINRMRG